MVPRVARKNCIFRQLREMKLCVCVNPYEHDSYDVRALYVDAQLRFIIRNIAKSTLSFHIDCDISMVSTHEVWLLTRRYVAIFVQNLHMFWELCV